MRILLFGGTAEGRKIAEYLSRKSCEVTVCVATDYGAALLPESENISVITARMDRAEMTSLISSRQFDCVIDATHPYALEVTDNISLSAGEQGKTLYRVVRECGDRGNWITAGSAAEAAKILENIPGNVLLTTGSKDLDAFADHVKRCYTRILPSVESINRCLELGYPRENIICMQGPFSKELNIALIRQFNIKTVVSKDTGVAGGFSEKAEAAAETKCRLIVIGRARQERGFNVDELIEKLESEFN